MVRFSSLNGFISASFLNGAIEHTFHSQNHVVGMTAVVYAPVFIVAIEPIVVQLPLSPAPLRHNHSIHTNFFSGSQAGLHTLHTEIGWSHSTKKNVFGNLTFTFQLTVSSTVIVRSDNLIWKVRHIPYTNITLARAKTKKTSSLISFTFHGASPVSEAVRGCKLDLSETWGGNRRSEMNFE